MKCVEHINSIKYSRAYIYILLIHAYMYMYLHTSKHTRTYIALYVYMYVNTTIHIYAYIRRKNIDAYIIAYYVRTRTYRIRTQSIYTNMHTRTNNMHVHECLNANINSSKISRNYTDIKAEDNQSVLCPLPLRLPPGPSKGLKGSTDLRYVVVFSSFSVCFSPIRVTSLSS